MKSIFFTGVEMYYTYILRCSDNSLYTGITTDIERRFREHEQQKSGICAKYTGSRKVIRIEALWQRKPRNRVQAGILHKKTAKI